MPESKGSTVRVGASKGVREQSNIASLSDICDCALSLERIEEYQREACNVQRNRTEYEESDNQDIWDWYHNQKGGSCNG